MKVYNKRNYSILFILVFLLTSGIPLYMYFSHDVEALRVSFPHRVLTADSIKYELRQKKPREWVELKNISLKAAGAIVISEDWSFYDHAGVDLEQMKVAVDEMMAGSRFRGASTITQQMVKNVFLSSDRNIWRKSHEIILAHKAEKTLNKRRILEIYLNCIEYGPNIYGITAASLHYFKKNPSVLTARESAFLAMLLPSPKRYYRSFKQKKLTAFARARVKTILWKMKVRKIISMEEYEYELSHPMSWEEL